jgi:UDP-N-acetylglucosamine--dolichyl-phosphate N-acetylglucosaminephosphotransferase
MTLHAYTVFSAATAFILTFACTPYLIRKLRQMNIVGVDGHKPDKPEIPEMGGLSMLFGYTIALLAAAFFISQADPGLDITPIYAVLGVFIIAAAIGAADDLYKLHHHRKPLMLLFAATPLILLKTGVPEIAFPFYTLDFTSLLGYDLTWLYWLIIVPIGVTGAANVVNMLAGFNGLMSSLAVTSCTAMALVSLALGEHTAALVFATMVGAQLAFLRFNWTPARIFPGDVGTLGFGALYAAAIIAWNMEFAGLIVFLPYLINGSMSLLSVGRFFEEKQFKQEKLAALEVTEDGLISFNKLEKPITLCKLMLYNRPQRESTLVLKLAVLSVISSIFALMFTWR